MDTVYVRSIMMSFGLERWNKNEKNNWKDYVIRSYFWIATNTNINAKEGNQIIWGEYGNYLGANLGAWKKSVKDSGHFREDCTQNTIKI